MTTVLHGVFSCEEAQSLSDSAANSDALGYPATSNFQESDHPENWLVDIYLLEDVSDETLLTELGPLSKRLTRKKLDDTIDWISEGLKDLKPVEVGPFFVHGGHDNEAVRPFHHAIRIEANQAFGTGHHGTTAGCLEAILDVTKRHKFRNVLDLGTGSGVLAVALSKTQKTPILATDIDPTSTRIAKNNMIANGVAPLVCCKTAAGFHHPIFKEKGPFGLVVANILAGPLRALAAPMSHHLSRNATIILSGLLVHQQKAVLSAYREQGMHLIRAIHREGWATLILKRY